MNGVQPKVYHVERSNNEGCLWFAVQCTATENPQEANAIMRKEHEAHPSDWLRVVETQTRVVGVTYGNGENVPTEKSSASETKEEKHLYLCAFDPRTGPADEVDAYAQSFQRWWRCVGSGCYLILTVLKQESISEAFRAMLGRKGRFVVIELERNSLNGQLDDNGWEWLESNTRLKFKRS